MVGGGDEVKMDGGRNKDVEGKGLMEQSIRAVTTKQKHEPKPN
jgi:hypothetical protein